MGIVEAIVVIALVVLGVIVSGAVALFVTARRGVRRLRQWGSQNQIADKVTERLEEAKSSPLARQIMGSLSAYQYLDPASVTSRQLMSVVSPMSRDAVIGRYATEIASAIGKVDFYEVAFASILESEFGSGSLTWERFHAPVSEATRDILSTSARMANRMQMFDTGEYLRLESDGVAPGSADADNLSAMQATLSDLDKMRDSNVRMVAGLDRLHAELSELPANRADEECEDLVGEIRRLSREAKLYA